MNIIKKNNLVLVIQFVSFIYMSAFLWFADPYSQKSLFFICVIFLSGALSRFYKFKRGASDGDSVKINKELNKLIITCILAPIALTVFVVLFK
ncbi:MAG: hypothetical protein M3005_04885 [Apilactobacillus sp.]|uniref:hypothetical protein n=1 Tax=Apilactobacillus sp. TaxID=2767901 RepID=UPI0025D44D32|nr:hypothetical protein [Apilactobacillus sp.]MCT6823196.1 hypothetical protein [Apilactobacillus sp.]MCT6858664.1 hypothetical protein [Apilactobacillus sp.]